MAATTLPAIIQPGNTLGTSSSVITACPAATQYVCQNSVFSNVSNAAVTITITITRSGGSPFGLITTQAIPAFGTYIASELAAMVLNSGDEIGGLCSAGSAVNVFISGYAVV
jgi:hypothetical protein